MSSDTGVKSEDPTPPSHITLKQAEDGKWWVVTDEETGVTTQGRTREHALEMIDEAVALHKGEIGHEPTDEELRELGIDPAGNTTGDEEPPDVLK